MNMKFGNCNFAGTQLANYHSSEVNTLGARNKYWRKVNEQKAEKERLYRIRSKRFDTTANPQPKYTSFSHSGYWKNDHVKKYAAHIKKYNDKMHQFFGIIFRQFGLDWYGMGWNERYQFSKEIVRKLKYEGKKGVVIDPELPLSPANMDDAGLAYLGVEDGSEGAGETGGADIDKYLKYIPAVAIGFGVFKLFLNK